MIDPDWQLVDLDPATWRRIGRFFDPGQYLRTARPGEHGLFVLHEDGTVVRCVDSHTGVHDDLIPAHIDEPQAYAQRLYARGEWQRVHVIDRAHLAQVARLAQQELPAADTLDGYYHRLYHLLWDDPRGYVSVPAHPGHWHGWTYERVRAWLERLPFSPASLALGVYEDGRWSSGLVLVCAQGQVRTITTFEALDAHSLAGGLTEETLSALSGHLAATIAPAAGLLLCTPEVFTAWIEQEEKREILLAARRRRQACWSWWADTAR